MKYLRQAALIGLLLILFISGCRKAYEATEYEVTEYGWGQYEDGDYVESYTWFQEAVGIDTTYKDGYNGLGWSLGQLGEMDSSIFYFTMGLAYPQPKDVVADVHRELWAGLTFACQAAGEDSLAVLYGDSLIDAITNAGVTSTAAWEFSHDENLDELDVQLMLALANYNLGRYSNCLDYIETIQVALGETELLAADTATVTGKQAIAEKMEELRDLLAAP